MEYIKYILVFTFLVWMEKTGIGKAFGWKSLSGDPEKVKIKG